MYRIIMAVIWIISCCKWGNWKSWKLYYPSIQFLIIGDLTCNFLLYNKPLWAYGGGIWNHTFADLFEAVVIYPCLVILFLTHYPQLIKKQIIYILCSVVIFTSYEGVSVLFGEFFYYDGWNIGWSLLLNCGLFSILGLHYKRPLLVWPISMVLAFVILYIFKIPFSIMR